MKYYYRIYGLNIRSEVRLDEAYEIREKNYEVDIQYGTIPSHIWKYRNSDEIQCLTSYDYKWFQYDKIGEFYIEQGSSIILAADASADERVLRSILLGPCFGCILYQRKILAIHGSAMVKNDTAVMISGQSGAGKSTISTALRKQGWLFLADDTVAITSENGYLYANPAYPQQKLCLDTATYFGYDVKQLIRINEERHKYAINVKEAFCPDRKEIKAMICLELSDCKELMIDEVKGSAKIEYIVNNLYTYYDFKYMGMSTLDFMQCLEISQKVPVFRIKRPPVLDTQKEIVDFINRCIDDTYIVDEKQEYIT